MRLPGVMSFSMTYELVVVYDASLTLILEFHDFKLTNYDKSYAVVSLSKMNSDLTNIASNLTNTVLANRGEQGQRNAVLVSQHGTNIRDPGFLSHDFRRTFHAPPRLYFTAESDEFDATTLQEWQNAGFTVEYFSMGKGGASYTRKLEALFNKPLEIGETFGLIGKCHNVDKASLYSTLAI